MSCRRVDCSNTLCPQAHEWYKAALILISEFHELPAWSDLSLSKDDVEFVRAALDLAMAEASESEHVDDVLHQCTATCVIWLVQQTRVFHMGDWVVPSLASLVNLSFRGMNTFLQHQCPTIHTHRKLSQLHFHSSEEELSSRRRGAQWLSDCMTTNGLPALHPNIVAQLPPAEMDGPTELVKSQRAAGQGALWLNKSVT